MVHLETVDELAEHIADLVGVYGCLPDNTGFSDHPDTCNCRICFVSDITERIRQAVKNEIFLSNMVELEKLVIPDIENKGNMPCRHPLGRCRFMIGRKKPYVKSPDKRLCGIASPDTECIRISRNRLERMECKNGNI